MQYQDSHISTCLIKTVIYLYCAYYACASYIFVIFTRIYLFVLCYSLLSFIYFVHCSIFILFCCSTSFLIGSLLLFVVHCLKREKCNSDPELCSGIPIPLLFNTIIRVNKHHTADSTDFVLV